MAASRAPKQWQLTKTETITSYESWRQNLIYIISLDVNFVPFLAEGACWKKKCSNDPLRGLTDDGDNIPAAQRRTAVQKNAHIDLMLGQIANYCPVISRNSIVKNSTSLSDIWQKIRQHFGFASTGAHFLDLCNITLQPDERPEDLFQRLSAFFEDNLLTVGCGVSHHGEPVMTDEDYTPTIENTVVFLWLQLVHSGLPQLVKQKYGAELRNRSLASLKPEISQALTSLLEELRTIEDSRAMRVVNTYGRRNTNRRQNFIPKSKSCVLCKTAGRSFNSHNLVECKFLPESDRRAMARIEESDDDCDSAESRPYCPDQGKNALIDEHSICRVNIIQSPVLSAFFHDHPVQLTLDTGATTNMVRASATDYYGFSVSPASQMARQADGVTPLDVVGEIHCQVTRGQHSFQLDALVVRQLDVDILAGNPFMTCNDIAVRPAKRQIVIGGSEIVNYGRSNHISSHSNIRRTQAFLLRSPQRTVVMPGEYLQLATPDDSQPDTTWALEPRLDSPLNSIRKSQNAWPHPQEVTSVGHTVRIRNDTDSLILVKNGEHLCQIRQISSSLAPSTNENVSTPEQPSQPSSTKPFSSTISIDPDGLLSVEERDNFRQLHLEYDDVFNPQVSKYNGASGKIEAVVNMGPTLPPQRKGRLPQYNRNNMNELQCKFDELESAGVFAKPEQVNVSVEYLNISFLVKKPSGGSRLVTSFGEVAHYSKPQPSLMPNVNSVLRDIGKWNYLIVSDLLQSFYQIPLSQSSMKYCGVATPYKGIRVYTRSAMGMPGSETCLEELMSRVLGDLIQEGCVSKIADDLYVGGNTPQEARQNWSRVLAALKHNNLRLSAKKTIICPKSTVVLGWVWSLGTLQASSHKVTALSTANPPPTVHGLRSYIGAYKVLSRVLHGYAELLDPLDAVVAGKESKSAIKWTDELLSAFKSSQQALSKHKSITIPLPTDSIWIVTDASVKQRGIAATLYVNRNGNLLLAGFFNAKLRKHQVTWLPCEVEALCIGAAVRHFAPYIVQSTTTTQILTDSKPCVQSCEKLKRGEFSSSARVSTFLSTVSRYGVNVRHIAGVANLPSDYTSRNPQTCPSSSCQVCAFIAELEDSVIRSLSVADVIDGAVKMPFTSRLAWLATQHECPDLRRSHAHLSQGTRPSKKATKIPDVKRYLKDALIARDGVLVVKTVLPFQNTCERIVVPRTVLNGLLTAMHIRFTHPSKFQLKRLFNRYFFALDIDKAIESITDACHACQSVKTIPIQLQPQETVTVPNAVGFTFAADVMRRYRQFILILRETATSYTLTTCISSEKHEELRNGLMILCAQLCPLSDRGVSIRVDPAPGFVSLTKDKLLSSRGIQLEIGRIKNVNKNPIAERAIKELGIELLHISPEGGPVSAVTLAIATSNMNNRIRRDGLSAQELWTQRDQITGDQLPIVDREIILNQNQSRIGNHVSSAKSKVHGRVNNRESKFSVGQLVYLRGDGNKTKAREKYIITSIFDEWCEIRKFTLSQFRSKSYTVRNSDCFPISTTTLDSSGPLRGQADIEDDDILMSDNEPVQPNYPEHSLSPYRSIPSPSIPRNPPAPASPTPPTPPSPPAMPEAIITPLELAEDTTPHPETSLPETVVHTNMDPSNTDTCVPGPRRSTRTRCPPKWQTSEWDYDSS